MQKITPTVFITGTSSGIGKAAVEKFAQAGWNVAATMRTSQPHLFSSYPRVRVYELNVTDDSSVISAFHAAITDFGTLNVVVNNAGYGMDGIFQSMTDEMIHRQFDTNVFGLMRVTRQAIPHLRDCNGGTIIQVSSMGGRLAFPLYSIYHSTKWAVEGFSESLRYELQQFGITIKIIEPGVIDTEFYGTSRQFSKPDNDHSYDEIIATVEAISHSSNYRQPPEKVAATIVAAATDGRRKLRYRVGKPAPLLLTLRRILPDGFFTAVIKRIYKL